MKKILVLIFILLCSLSFNSSAQWGQGSTIDEIKLETFEIEGHIHAKHRLITQNEMQTATVKADTSEVSFYTFDLTAAADSTFGTAVQILGSDDTPWTTGYTVFDLSEGFVTAVNSNAVYKLRVSWGASIAEAWAAKDYSDTWFRGDSSNPQQSHPVEFSIAMHRLPVGTLVWVQIANAAGAQTASFLFAGHEYIE